MSEGAVGDMNYTFFDKDGKTRPEWNCFLGLDVNFFCEMATTRRKRSLPLGAHRRKNLYALLCAVVCSTLGSPTRKRVKNWHWRMRLIRGNRRARPKKRPAEGGRRADQLPAHLGQTSHRF
jgi:hypothetical protein